MDELLTVSDVAALLKLNEQTVRNWIDGGKLPAIRIGRRVRIKQRDLEQLLEAGYSGHDQAGTAVGPSKADSMHSNDRLWGALDRELDEARTSIATQDGLERLISSLTDVAKSAQELAHALESSR